MNRQEYEQAHPKQALLVREMESEQEGQEEECGSDFEEVTTEQQGQETEAG